MHDEMPPNWELSPPRHTDTTSQLSSLNSLNGAFQMNGLTDFPADCSAHGRSTQNPPQIPTTGFYFASANTQRLARTSGESYNPNHRILPTSSIRRKSAQTNLRSPVQASMADQRAEEVGSPNMNQQHGLGPRQNRFAHSHSVGLAQRARAPPAASSFGQTSMKNTEQPGNPQPDNAPSSSSKRPIAPMRPFIPLMGDIPMYTPPPHLTRIQPRPTLYKTISRQVVSQQGVSWEAVGQILGSRLNRPVSAVEAEAIWNRNPESTTCEDLEIAGSELDDYNLELEVSSTDTDTDEGIGKSDSGGTSDDDEEESDDSVGDEDQPTSNIGQTNPTNDTHPDLAEAEGDRLVLQPELNNLQGDCAPKKLNLQWEKPMTYAGQGQPLIQPSPITQETIISHYTEEQVEWLVENVSQYQYRGNWVEITTIFNTKFQTNRSPNGLSQRYAKAKASTSTQVNATGQQEHLSGASALKTHQHQHLTPSMYLDSQKVGAAIYSKEHDDWMLDTIPGMAGMKGGEKWAKVQEQFFSKFHDLRSAAALRGRWSVISRNAVQG